MSNRSQLDLLISSLVLIRKASSAIDTALSLPAADRAKLEESVETVRGDLGNLLSQVGGAIPGASMLGKRPEVKMAAGIVEFVARHSASQLGVVAGVADTLRSGGDSRALAHKIERHLAENGAASRDDLAEALGIDPGSPRLQEAIERALGRGLAEWYGPDLYGLPRAQLEELAERETDAGGAPPEPADGEADRNGSLGGAVSRLESSLESLGAALRDTDSAESGGAEQIRELRRLADEGLISEPEFEAKRREILERL